MVQDKQPDTPSSDYEAMAPYWRMVSTILGGTESMRKATQYLPRFVKETKADYDFRRTNAKFTNVFRDIVENLAAKPFSEEAGIKDGSGSGSIERLAEDIDGQGNHIHLFAANTFFNGIAYGLDWILVDYTRGVPKSATIEQERRIGARPYWVRIPPECLLAAYSARIEGTEQFVHVRIKEDFTERNGYGERTIKQVRVFNREPVYTEASDDPVGWGSATWQVFRKEKAEDGREEWVEKASGDISIGVIPLVPFLTGRRKGSSWQIVPSMQDAADLQIELYQQESGLKYAKEATAFPMLAGNGVEPPQGADGTIADVPVGPKSVLYAPPSTQGQPGNWSFIEPSATSLRFLADDVKETIQQLRELGRQPLTAQTGNLTVVTTAFAAQKGNSAIKAWALNLKDAMENALRFTAMWLREEREPEFQINTDFDVGLQDDKGPDALIKMRERNDISQKTLWHEMRRRSILSPDFDADAEEQALIDEMPGEPTEGELIPPDESDASDPTVQTPNLAA